MVYSNKKDDGLRVLERELSLFGLESELSRLNSKSEIVPADSAPSDSKAYACIERELALMAIEKKLVNLSFDSEPEYNLFDAFYVHKETQVSTLLAYLFNWSNTLEFENRFLTQFLKMFVKRYKQQVLQQKNWDVQLEVNVEDKEQKKSRRPDIVLESEHAVVFIENKIFPQAIRAGQILDTCQYISSKTRWRTKKKIYLVLLPSKNQEMKIAKELEDAGRHMDETGLIYWAEMADLFSNAKNWAKENSRLHYTLVDFFQYAKRLGGVNDGIR